MSATTDSNSDPEAVRAAAQSAVDATATLYAGDAGLDVAARIRVEMQRRGFEVEDESWLAEVAKRVRSGHDVRVGLPGQAPEG